MNSTTSTILRRKEIGGRTPAILLPSFLFLLPAPSIFTALLTLLAILACGCPEKGMADSGVTNSGMTNSVLAPAMAAPAAIPSVAHPATPPSAAPSAVTTSTNPAMIPSEEEESEVAPQPVKGKPAKKPKPKAAPTPPPIPEGVRFERDVTYLPAERSEKADLYMPAVIAEGARLPAVVIIHGGGFNDGDKTKSREINIGTNLALNGYLAMSINYKLRKMPGQVTWPQCVYDAKTAVRWLRANADRLHVDPDHIGVIGGSAGGNLAGMVAFTGPRDGLEPEVYAGYPSSVACAVIMYGAVDLMNLHDFKMFNKTRAEDPEVYKKASPVTYVRADSPPTLILHGTGDTVVDVSQSRTLADALEKAGAPHELMIIPDAPHTFELQSFIDLRPKVIGFFDTHLKSSPPTPTATP